MSVSADVRRRDLARIRAALEAAAKAVAPYVPGNVAFTTKAVRGDPLTAADLAADEALGRCLPEPGEGWLSEESADDPVRRTARRVWVVDPIDGTREFVEGIPEWCVSVALVEDGRPVAGGILNPARDELVLGAEGLGVTFCGEPARVRDPEPDERLRVLASRSELKRGEWDRYGDGVEVVPCGSVAYKMALVAAGQADATWTLVPKSEWDVAAGVALVRAAGGVATLADGAEPEFNQPDPTLPNFVCAGPRTYARILASGWVG